MKEPIQSYFTLLTEKAMGPGKISGTSRSPPALARIVKLSSGGALLVPNANRAIFHIFRKMTLRKLLESAENNIGRERPKSEKGNPGGNPLSAKPRILKFRTAGLPVWKPQPPYGGNMRISDQELQKVIANGGISLVETGHGFEASPRESDTELIKDLTHQIIEMKDREDMVAELKARIEAGEYHPSADEIADVMIRRAIADRVR